MNNQENDRDLRSILRQAVPPVGNTNLQGDLWPQMLRRLDEQVPGVPWFDWALAALTAIALWFFPGTIPALLYHL